MMETRLQSNEVRIPKPEFDLSTSSQCQYFKSSFARSLSFSCSQTKSLDFGINTSPPRKYGRETATINEEVIMSPSSASSSSFDNTITDEASCSAVPKNLRNLWATKAQGLNKSRRSFDTSEIEVLRLRKECQSLIEENRRLLSLTNDAGSTSSSSTGNCNNVEAVILQTQVETLQWQLKQVDASRLMYRAVMEEVVRFLERCHRSLDGLQICSVVRSKSVHQVPDTLNNDVDDTNCNGHDGKKKNGNELRTRSSTNLIDSQKVFMSHNSTQIPVSPGSSYNNFRDFTWRRSPKRALPPQISNIEMESEKLSQDAFRLLRTAQNLLNTQEPVLSQTKTIIEMPIVPTPKVKQTITNDIDAQSLCLSFNRKINMRESRSSLRSSTDDSVHSNSSSKTETDEENVEVQAPPVALRIMSKPNRMERNKDGVSSSVEDESGFSSMSSFQEIGLPATNSTMLRHHSPPPRTSSAASTSDESTEGSAADKKKTSYKSILHSKLGLPIIPNHKRWDSAPSVPPKKTLHHFNAPLTGEEAVRVLWV